MAKFGLALFLAALSLRLVVLGRNALALRDLRSGTSSAGASPASVSPPNLSVQLSVVALGLLAALAFIFWLYRVCRNWATQGKPRFSPTWAVLAWLVPPFVLWRPAQIMVDLFADRPGMRKIDDADAWLIAVWWIAGVIGLFGRVGLRFWEVSSLADRLNWHYVALGVYGLLGLSAAAGLVLVSQLTARHDVGARS